MISRDYQCPRGLQGQKRIVLPIRAESRRAGPSEDRTGATTRRGRGGNNAPLPLASSATMLESTVDGRAQLRSAFSRSKSTG
jgi:hypothetical protein